LARYWRRGKSAAADRRPHSESAIHVSIARRSAWVTEEHSEEWPYTKGEGGPQAKNAFGGDSLPGGSMPGKVFGNSHAVLQAVMD
jgi:hypothetical protein